MSAAAVAACLLGGCSGGRDMNLPSLGLSSSGRPGYGPRVVESGPIPKGGGSYKVGQPYRIGSSWYVPQEEPGYDRSGVGSWYGADFHGRRTANGEIYDMMALTAAHPTLPLPSYAWVTNLANGRTILVRVNDRGPYVANRVIDLSKASAQALGYENAGTAQVRVRYAGRAPLDGNDRREREVLANAPWLAGRYAQAAGPAPRPMGQVYGQGGQGYAAAPVSDDLPWQRGGGAMNPPQYSPQRLPVAPQPAYAANAQVDPVYEPDAAGRWTPESYRRGLKSGASSNGNWSAAAGLGNGAR